MDKVLAIQNCGPSGTTFLQSLLDRHPSILSLPALHGQQIYIYWDHIAPNKKELSTEHFYKYSFNVVLELLQHLYDSSKLDNGLGLRELGENRNEASVTDKDKFIDLLCKYLPSTSEAISRKQFVVSIYRAYNEALGVQVSNDGYLLYPIHCLPKKYAEYLIEDFAKVSFLHTVRNPVQSIGSLAKHIYKNPDWQYHYLMTCVSAQMLCDHAIHVGSRTAYGMKPYFSDFSDGSVVSRAVRLEDLHNKSTETLQKICDWINIAWSDTLLQSTFDGKQWHNRPESIRQSGIGSSIIAQQHEDIFSNYDKQRLQILSKPFSHFYNYEISVDTKNPGFFSALKQLMCPFKIETSRYYIDQYINAGCQDKKPGAFRVAVRWFKYVKSYIACRVKWLLPAMIASRKNDQSEFVPLL